MSPCPHLPSPDRAYTSEDIAALGHHRGVAFVETCLKYAQCLWREGFPAKSILLINRAMSVPCDAVEPPYRAIAWMLQNRPQGRFIGNPRRHWQHYATRMNEGHKELRIWRAWACWFLACRILPEAEFPADHEQIREEGIVEPSRLDIAAHLPPADFAAWSKVLSELGVELAEPPPVRIRRIGSSELPVVKRLAHEIWHASYPGIIPVGQIHYMLRIWYEPGAMAREMEMRGVWFALIEVQHLGAVGYVSFEKLPEESVIFINKLYLLPQMHGRGLGAAALTWTTDRARENGAERIRLRVNKKNAVAIRAYLRHGFTFKEDIVTDIGSGYVMDDYVLEKVIRPVSGGGNLPA
jgi:GNAT superfamily N-acetyltransferase